MELYDSLPMTHDPKKLLSYWHKAAETVLVSLSAGLDVVFLVEGFGHLVRTVLEKEPSIKIETIAGVAAAASSGKTLVEVEFHNAVL